MENWKLLLQKSKDNIETAELLFNNNKLGLAAFNAQQSVELAIKAYVLFFDLSQKKQDSIFKTHIPSKILLKDLLFDIIETQNSINLRELDELISRLTNYAFQQLQKIVRIMKKVDSDKQQLEELWKYSLNITSNESRITEFYQQLNEESKSKIPFELVESFIVKFRTLFNTIFHDMIKQRKSHLIESLKNEIIVQSASEGIPEKLIEVLFNEQTGKLLYDNITSNLKLLDSFDMIEYFYGKNGITTMLEKLSIKQIFIPDIKERTNTLRMFFLGYLSNVVLLTYSHEEFGRYSKMIDGKTTDELYLEHINELQHLITLSRNTYEKTKSLINNFI